MNTPIVMWGAGAIGGTIGAYLVRAGRQVIFVDTVAEHVSRIQSGALVINSLGGSFTVGAPAFIPSAFSGTYDLIFLAVKASATIPATLMLQKHLSPNGVVVSLQNGINEIQIGEIIGPERTIGAFINPGADWIGPGEISYSARGTLAVGELDGRRTPRAEFVLACLQDFEPNTVLTDNINGYLWAKMAYAAVLTASALTGDVVADFLESDRMRPLVTALIREVLTVCSSEDINPERFQGFNPVVFMRGDWAGIHESLTSLAAERRQNGKLRSGIWRDLAVRKRKTEVREQFAPIQATARRNGVEIPTIGTLVDLVREVELGKREIGPSLAEELISRAAALH
jgi:2-dehydropantoate 2-reductase